MKQKQLVLKAARYIIFEALEVLLIPATVGIVLLSQGGALYLLTMSLETALDQEILPGPEEWMTLIFLGLFLLAWIFVFYFWRRRAGLRRLIGQCTAVLLSLAAAGLWAVLAVSVILASEKMFFVFIPCILTATAAASLVFSLLPLKSLVRWQLAQRTLTKMSK